MSDARQRGQRGAERRERITESVAAVLFVAVAVAMAVGWATDALDVVTAVVLVGCFVVLHQVEFDVGEGRTRPVQLVLVPMLLLLPPAAVPLIVASALLLAQLPGMVARREPWGLLHSLADGWFSVAPALVLATLGLSEGFWAAAAVLGVAVAAQIATDFAAATLRLRFGLALSVRDLLGGFAWVYLVDVLLTPVAVLAAGAGSASPLHVTAVLPLAALLAVFARERRGRIDNALELHRLVAESEQRLQSIVQNSSDVIAIVTHEGVVRTLTGAVEGIFGADWQTATGTSLLDRVHPDDTALVGAFLDGVAADAPGASQTLEWRIRRHDQLYRYVETVATNLLSDERLKGIVLTARDVDERKAFEEQLRHRAFHDPLTQLANRGLFYDRIEHALSRQPRQEHRVAVLFVDLDDFKLVNDQLGHAVGDELLVGVARRLRGCVRSADTVARLGGDEFGVLLESVAGVNEPVQIAERIMSALAEPFSVHGERITAALSIGLTVSRPGDPNVDELLRQADLAMYSAKRHGKRRWEVYDAELSAAGAAPRDSEEPERATWFQRGAEQREEILALLHRDDAISAVFQPVLDLRSGAVSGYEALARFATADARPPNAWFAQAHRCGLGYELEAKALAAALSAPGRPEGTYLTLNLSPSALASEPVQAVLPARLDGLVIEITEHELLTDEPGFQAALDDLRARGGRIAVDDAGAGYAGLKHVMRVAPDLIKLDRSLVDGVHADAARAALVSSFVRFAQDSDATVCAEGIETLDDLVCLADLDVTYGQGWVIARPTAAWPKATPESTEACASSFVVSIAGRDSTVTGDLREHALEQILARAAMTPTAAQLPALEVAIAAQLRAEDVAIFWRHGNELYRGTGYAGPTALGPGLRAALEDRTFAHELVGDPTADPREANALQAHGWCSVLRIPLVWHDRVVGVLEARNAGNRPWSRSDIRRVRIISHQLGAALDTMERSQASAPLTTAGT
ncbi:MAG: diguanylate cyclase domain-containing protein [Thermoleophilaceae bacterium]